MIDLYKANDILGKKIAEAFCIKHCKAITIKMAHNEISTVTAEFYPEVDGVKQLESVLGEYTFECTERNWDGYRHMGLL